MKFHVCNVEGCGKSYPTFNGAFFHQQATGHTSFKLVMAE